MPDDPIGDIRALGLPPPNYDEGNLSEAPPLLSPVGPIIDGLREEWLGRFATEIYGQIPPRPDSLSIERQAVQGERAERIVIRLQLPGGALEVDAALWLPEREHLPAPVILGLDFKGPIGLLTGEGFPIDREARVAPVFEGDGRLTDALRGTAVHRWPADLLNSAGFAVLVSCYGSWVPDDPDLFQERGLYPLLADSVRGPRPGALALWSWAISRLVDVAGLVPEIDAGAVAVAGHSRLGKAALLAAAWDTRISSAMINNSGAMGASISSRNYGETRQHLVGRFPHWLSADAVPVSRALDQHQLLATIAPRQLYVTSASEDLWADPKGEYISLQAAASAWPGAELPPVGGVFVPGAEVASGAIGWHLRPGPHDIRPYDWHRYLRHLRKLGSFSRQPQRVYRHVP